MAAQATSRVAALDRVAALRPADAQRTRTPRWVMNVTRRPLAVQGRIVHNDADDPAGIGHPSLPTAHHRTRDTERGETAMLSPSIHKFGNEFIPSGPSAERAFFTGSPRINT